MGEWISVGGESPEENSLVIGARFYESMHPDAAIFLFLNGRFHLWTDGIEVSYPGGNIEIDMVITHWMPLPAPPEPHQGQGGGHG